MNPEIIAMIVVGIAVVIAAVIVGFGGSLFSSHSNNYHCNCVAFRLDDVQAYWERLDQQNVMTLFNATNTPLTVGVIGYGFSDDHNSTQFLKHVNVEIANHGWKHEDFTTLPFYEQVALMNKTNNEIQSLYGKRPTVFIPPYNAVDTNVTLAARYNNMSMVSGYIDTQKYFRTLVATSDNIVFQEVPGTVNAGDLSESNKTQWTSFTSEKIHKEIIDSMAKNGFAVVVLHPQVFHNSDKQVSLWQYQQLFDLIQQLKFEHYNLTTLSKVK